MFFALAIPALGFFGSLLYLMALKFVFCLKLAGFGKYFLSFIRTCDSTWFTWVTQSNHIVMDIHDEDDSDTWLSLQVRK